MREPSIDSANTPDPDFVDDTVERLDRYVPLVASEWDLDAPGQTWRAVEGTLCFIDISGFTMLAERLSRFGRIGAEELTEVLARVFGSMLRLAYDRAGSLLKFGGDALLFLFVGDDHPVQAASAAVEMRAELRNASRISTSVGPLRLRMSVGIHTGTVHLVRVGGSHRELLITGPAATTTTQMEKYADAGEILVSPTTAKLLPRAAAELAKGPGWLLSWRAARGVGPGPLLRADIDAETIASHLPRLLRDHLRHGTAESEHRMATIAFLRFEGVDAIMGSTGPAAVATAIEQVVVAVQDAVDAEGVTFLATDIDADGGKIILATGVPSVQGDDEARMLRALRRIADTPTTLPVRIGVHQGHVFAGEIGTEFRSTFTVMGDTVNLAARLMAAAAPGAIYASPTVLAASSTLFATTALEPFRVKGKSEPLQAYALGQIVGTRAADVRRALPFVGRREERKILRDAIVSAIDGSGQVVEVSGPTGIGKSRLVIEALAEHPALAVLSLQAESYGSTTPYRALRDPVRQLLGLTANDPEAMLAELDAALLAIDPELVSMKALIGELVHLSVPLSPEVAAIEPRFRPDRMVDLLEWLLAHAHPGPLALLVEDGQWLDDASSYLLQRLSAALAHRPWVMLVVRRESDEGFVPANRTLVSVDALSVAEATELLVAATDATPLRPHDLVSIVRRCDGNPLFLEEIVGVVRGRGGIVSLPESLEAVVSAQIDALAPTPRRVLRYAAVLGRSFRTVVLDELLAADQLELDPVTRSVLDGFLERTDGRMRFRHALLRDVAYEGLSYRRRRDLHRRAGETTERLAGRHPENVAALLALHASLADDHERAWRYGRLAGDRARQAFANEEAVESYERALAAARRLPEVAAADRAGVWTALGDAREQAGIFDRALDAYRRASTLVGDDPVARADLFLKRARARERSGAFAPALGEITRGVSALDGLAASEAGAARARLASLAAIVRQAQERPREALAQALRAVDEAQRADEPAALARAYGVLDWAYRSSGRHEQAVYGPQALAIYERIGDLAGQATVTGNLGVMAYFEGRWDDALESYRRARSALLRAGNAVQAALTTANIGEVLVNQGRLADAEPLLREASRVLRASGFSDGATFAEVQLARVLADRDSGTGNLDEAERLLLRAWDDTTARHQPASALEAALYLAECRHRRGEPDRALEILDVSERAAGGDAVLFSAALARVRAGVLAGLGRLDEASDQIAAGLAVAREQDLPYETAMLILEAAEIARRAGRAPDAASLAEASAIMHRLGVRATRPEA